MSYYVVFDPFQQLGEAVLQVYELRAGRYHQLETCWLPEVGLGLTLRAGTFEGMQFNWLRWCDAECQVLLTGDEKAAAEKSRADRLAELLRAQGIDPDRVL